MKPNSPQYIGSYTVTHCTTGAGRVFWQVHYTGKIDAISHHDTERQAVNAAKRYQKADERRAQYQPVC